MLLSTDIQEIEKKYPKIDKIEKNNPLNPGDKINSWTVLYRIKNAESNHIMYLCRCDCGTIVPVRKTELIHNKTQHCKHCNGVNLTGQKFGRLTVIKKSYSKENRGYWICKCDCGNEIVTKTNLLTSGQTQSCGCLLKENMHEKRIDLTNQRFGKLIALYPIVKITPSNKEVTYWHCKCDCGNETDVVPAHLVHGSTKSCGCINSLQEENIIKLLKENNIPFKYQHKFKDINQYKFDFYIEDKYIVEFDGKQHFLCYETGWNNKENLNKTHQNDLLKNKYCFEHDIPIIRIPYDINYTLDDMRLETTRFLLTPENEEEYYELRK